MHLCGIVSMYELKKKKESRSDTCMASDSWARRAKKLMRWRTDSSAVSLIEDLLRSPCNKEKD